MGEYLLERGQFISGYTTEENGIPSSNICWLPVVRYRGGPSLTHDEMFKGSVLCRQPQPLWFRECSNCITPRCLSAVHPWAYTLSIPSSAGLPQSCWYSWAVPLRVLWDKVLPCIWPRLSGNSGFFCLGLLCPATWISSIIRRWGTYHANLVFHFKI